MPITLAQRSFSGGEISPSLYPRTDTTKYATGLRTMRNTWTKRSGGSQNRPGSYFVGEVRDSTAAVRLIPFVFNNDQTYALEFSNLRMRVIREQAQVTEAAKTITAVTTASPAVFTSALHGFNSNDEIYLTGIVGLDFVNNRNYIVANATANTFRLQYLGTTTFLDTTGLGTYVSGGTAERIYTIVSPYTTAQLPYVQFVQSADVVTFVHPDHPVKELRRTGHTSWTFTDKTFAPAMAAPGSVVNSGAGSGLVRWVVTAISADNGEESLQSAHTENNGIASPCIISWAAVTNTAFYNIYREGNSGGGFTGVYNFVGTSTGTSFRDENDTLTPDDINVHPPQARNPFGSTDNRPSCVTIYQQRLGLAATTNLPETAFFSRTGSYNNFTTSIPSQDDDSVTFTAAGRQVNKIIHMLDIGGLVLFTQSSEIAVNAPVLTPFDIQLKVQTYNGSSYLSPITIDGSAIYIQERGSVVRDITFNLDSDGYRGNDLTTFASHLVEKNTIVDWAFQKTPNSIVWLVRDDGTLLGMTYVAEQQILAWHHHDFDGGVVENVCCIPEGGEDSVYLVIRRTISSRTVRYVEVLKTRQVTDVADCVYMDSALTYDGTNTNTSHNMTISGGTTWAFNELLTLTSSIGYFVAADVGNEIHITKNGVTIRFRITEFVNTGVVRGFPDKTVTIGFQGFPISAWAKAVDQVDGLWHLQAKNVSVLGDGFVVGSPNNPAVANVYQVGLGRVTLDRCYAKIHIGLPYISDIETLDIDLSGNSSVIGKKKAVNKVYAQLEDSRGMWVGCEPPSGTDVLEGLTELKIRQDEGYDSPVRLATSKEEIIISSRWNSNGRVFIRQVDPLPLSVLAVFPEGSFGIGQGGQ